MTDESHAPGAAISPSRLETLVDGVFAIAMTILVLDLKVPELTNNRSVPDLARALAHQIPTFLSYLLSFVVLGLFWYRHNQHYRCYRAVSHGMLALHFVQLAAAASFPFCAALIGLYGPNPLSVVVYLACMLVYAWAACLSWIVARRSGSLRADVSEAEYRRTRKRALNASAIITVLFVANLFRVAASPGGSVSSASSDDAAIRALAARWQKAVLDRDPDVQASMFADDGVSYHDGQEPLVGPTAIRAWEARSRASHPKATITSATDAIRIAAAGDMAVQTGEGRLTSLGADGEDHAIHRQRFVTVWKKVDGQWKVAHDIAVNVTPWQ